MHLLAYIRVSTEDQASGGHSLALVQPERLRAWALANGHELVDVIVDGEGEGDAFRGVSGGLPLARRPGGAELLRRLANGEAQGVVVASLTRLFRDVDDGRFFIRKAWRKAGIQLFCLDQPIDITTAFGRFMLNQALVAAEYEREQTAERTAQVAQSLRRAGRVYGDVPYGCVARDGKLFRDAAAWGVREGIVALRATGKPYQAISDWLRTQRIPAPGGGSRWPKSTLARICDTHESLAHLPIDDQPASAAGAAPDTTASTESKL